MRAHVRSDVQKQQKLKKNRQSWRHECNSPLQRAIPMCYLKYFSSTLSIASDFFDSKSSPSHIDVQPMETPEALVAPGYVAVPCLHSLVVGVGLRRMELGSGVCMLTLLVQSEPPLTFQSNLVGGGSIIAGGGRAGESRSRCDRACDCAQMESLNLIPFNCLLIHFSSISESWLGCPRVLGSPFGQQKSLFFSSWL